MKTHNNHWNHVGIVSFCKVMGFWEFYETNENGFIFHRYSISEKQLKGYGRARSFAKKLNKQLKGF